jgi:hypothetical protein
MNLKLLPIGLGVAATLTLAFAPAVFAAPAIYKSGTGVMQQTCGGDLDTKVFDCNGGSNDSNKDVYFIAHTSTNRVITYNNHIFNKIVRMASKPGYAACASAPLGFNEYGAKKNVGRWFCVLTSAGRFARLHIDKVVAGGPMTITFRTWCKPTDGC